MWRYINEKEKEFLMSYYRSGGGNKIFLALILIFMFKNMVGNSGRNFLLMGIFGIFFLILVIMVVSNASSKKARKLSIENNEVQTGEGTFVSYRRIGRRKRRNYYEVDVNVYDVINQAYFIYKCEYLGRSYEITNLRVGDVMSIFVFDGEKLKTIEKERI